MYRRSSELVRTEQATGAVTRIPAAGSSVAVARPSYHRASRAAQDGSPKERREITAAVYRVRACERVAEASYRLGVSKVAVSMSGQPLCARALLLVSPIMRTA